MERSAERTDAQVVRDVLEGDRDAYRLLVQRYGDVIHRNATRMVGEGDTAADLVQEAFVTGYRKLHTCRDPERVGAWLFRIAANRCRDHLRRSERTRLVPIDAVPDLSSRLEGPGEAAERAEAHGRIHGALEGLSGEQKEAFILKHVDGRSYEEIAAVMDTSVAAVKMRVHRARESLRPLLEAYR
jgi:RNA polymerase sigma-70 factor (ECF subfamily)